MVLKRFVFLAGELNQDLHGMLANVNIRNEDGVKYFLHDEVAFVLNFEVLGSVGQRVEKCLHCEFCGRESVAVRRFSFVFVDTSC
jgi:hypothetical protein